MALQQEDVSRRKITTTTQDRELQQLEARRDQLSEAKLDLEDKIKQLRVRLKAEEYDRMLIEKDLGNEDRRLNMLVTQYEELNHQLITNIEIEERARVLLDKKMEAQRVLLHNTQEINKSETLLNLRPRTDTLSYLRTTGNVHVCGAGKGYCHLCQRDPHSQ